MKEYPREERMALSDIFCFLSKGDEKEKEKGEREGEGEGETEAE